MSTATISNRKINANRTNALHSTGPQSQQGKARSSQNALRHGYFAKSLLLPGDDPAELEQLKADCLRRLNPRDVMELRIADSLIAGHWRLAHLRQAECRMLTEVNEKLNEHRQQSKKALDESIGNLQIDAGHARFAVQRATTPQRLEHAQQRLKEALEKLAHEKHKSDGLITNNHEMIFVYMLSHEQTRIAFESLQRHIRQLENGLNRSMRQLRELRKEALPEELTDLTRQALSQLDPSIQVESGNPDTPKDLDKDDPIGSDASDDGQAACTPAATDLYDPRFTCRADDRSGDTQNERNEPTAKLVGGQKADRQSQSEHQFDTLPG